MKSSPTIRRIRDLAFEGRSAQTILEDVKVIEAIREGYLSEASAKRNARKAVGLYGHPDEKIEHMIDSLIRADLFNVPFNGLETHAGGYDEVFPQLLKFNLDRAAATNGYHEYYRFCDGKQDVSDILKNIKASNRALGLKNGDKNVIDFDVYGLLNLFNIFREGFLNLFQNSGGMLVISSMQTGFFRKLKYGTKIRDDFVEAFGSSNPDHDDVRKYVIKYCQHFGYSCDHLLDRELPNENRENDMRMSFFVKPI